MCRHLNRYIINIEHKIYIETFMRVSFLNCEYFHRQISASRAANDEYESRVNATTIREFYFEEGKSSCRANSGSRDPINSICTEYSSRSEAKRRADLDVVKLNLCHSRDVLLRRAHIPYAFIVTARHYVELT